MDVTLPIDAVIEKKQFETAKEEMRHFLIAWDGQGMHPKWNLAVKCFEEGMSIGEMATEFSRSTRTIRSWVRCGQIYTPDVTENWEYLVSSHYEAACTWTDSHEWLTEANKLKMSATAMIAARRHPEPELDEPITPPEGSVSDLQPKWGDSEGDAEESVTGCTESVTGSSDEPASDDCDVTEDDTELPNAEAFDDGKVYDDVEDGTSEEPPPDVQDSMPEEFKQPHANDVMPAAAGRQVLKQALTTHVKGLLVAINACAEATGGKGPQFSAAYSALTEFHNAAEKMVNGEL